MLPAAHGCWVLRSSLEASEEPEWCPEGGRSLEYGGGRGGAPPLPLKKSPYFEVPGGGQQEGGEETSQDRELENHTPRLVTPEGVGG